MRIAMAADPRTFGSFIEKELGTALDETGMDSVTREGMMKLVRDWMAVAGDASAADLVIPGKALVSGSTVVEIRDSAAFLKLVEGLPAQIRESGIDKLYADMGIPMKVEVSMNVRQENGIPVHRLTFRTDAEGASGPAAAIAKTVMGDGIVYDFAVVDGHAVYALGGESVGDLIDAVKAGAHPDARPAAAEAVFGPDASFYCDYNIGKLIEVMAGILPKAGLPDKAVKTIRDTADALSGSRSWCRPSCWARLSRPAEPPATRASQAPWSTLKKPPPPRRPRKVRRTDPAQSSRSGLPATWKDPSSL